MADDKSMHNGIQDTKISRIEEDIKDIKKSVRVLNHNTTENAANIEWMKWAIFAILGSIISIAIKLFAG